MIRNTDYDIALSFAGEDRSYVEMVAEQLTTRGVSVFYDKYEQADLWGKDLYVHLTEVYRTRAQYTLMFISKHYKKRSGQTKNAEQRNPGQLKKAATTYCPHVLTTLKFRAFFLLPATLTCDRTHQFKLPSWSCRS